MRHRRRPGGTRLRDLAEVAQRDVGPDIRRQIVENPVGVAHPRVELRLPVVRLDLCGQRGELEPERLDELAGELLPVE